MLSSLVVGAAIAAIAATQAPQPEELPAWSPYTKEIAVLGGYARGKVFDPGRTPTQLGQAMVRFALHFAPLGSGWRRGNFALVIEGVIMTIDQEPRATGGGPTVLLRYTWAKDRWRPMFFFGAGALFTNEEVPPGEVKTNFTPQVGVGLQYLLRRDLALGGEYRFHHISNNGQTDDNPGINSHLVIFGVSWYR